MDRQGRKPPMPRSRRPRTPEQQPGKKQTPTFLLELPLRVTPGQAKRVRAHLEAARQLYNALLSEGQRRLRRMRADPAWQAARAIPRAQKQERHQAFGALRQQYNFSEYAFHESAKILRCPWMAEHIDAVLAQTLASRAYRTLNRVCLGQARRVRFKSRSRGLASVENKRTDTGLRFVLQRPEEGNAGYLLWQGDQLPALIDWHDPVVAYGLAHRVKYARLIQRKASSPRASGADALGYCYCVHLALEGVPYYKPNHSVGGDTVGLDLGPSTIAIVPREGKVRLDLLCAELAPDAKAIRRLQRQMERQRRANNPENYDERGRIKRRGAKRLKWKHSQRYLATRWRKATKERKLAALRKSLHGRLAHEIVALGHTIITEKLAYRGWQKQFGKSVGLRAPGMFMDLLRRTVARTGGTAGRAFPRAAPNCRSSVMAAGNVCASRCGSAGTRVPVVSGRCSAIYTVPFWPPTWTQQISFPRVPGTSGTGKVGSPACGQHTSTPFNARVRGKCCPAPLVSPESERVCPKVHASHS
jgi:hypothetical protein